MRLNSFLAGAALGAGVLLSAAPAVAQLTTISYQGQLEDAGGPASGPFEIRFGLWDAELGGTMLAEHVSMVTVSADGFFLADDIPFAPFFDGTARWMSLAVTPDGGSETMLDPRQPISLTPHSAYAQRSGTSLQDAADNGSLVVGDVDIDGGLDLGGSTNGRLRVYGDFASNILVDLRNDGTRGGRIDIRDTNNNIAAFLSTDPSGGARFTMARDDTGATGFSVDGNVSGSAATRVDITGESQLFVFDTSVSGDASTVLPDGAVNAAEMFNEPGVAEIHANALSQDIEAGIGPILSRTITVPGPGYVVAIANLEVLIGFITGSDQLVSIGVSDEPDAFFEGLELSEDIPASTGTGTYNFVISPSLVFPVDTAGAHTYYLVGQEGGGNGGNFIRASDAQITLLYVPTAYGAIGLNVLRSGGGPEEFIGPAAPPLSDAEIAAERLAEVQRSNAALLARQRELERRLEDQQRRLDALLGDAE
ncbi:MAG: hypothetical protein DHS20C14_13450 [Phycisphaeraceae bacterium]|nr:MAG: hypothetical protein DHS20C14_13450 [Phycisphaeraceae bacterium]